MAVRNILATLLALLVVASGVCHAENVDMFVGEVKVLGTVAVDRVAVGSGQVVRAEILGSGELLVIAQSPGSSSLRLWNKDGSQNDFNIRVTEKDPEKRVRMESMINMHVKLVEFRKVALGELGIDWDKSINGPAFSTVGDFVSSKLFRSPDNSGINANLPLSVNPFSTHFGIATSITSTINYLATTGDAMLLAEPTLSCINGGNAEFLAGGEVPYPVTSALGQTNVDFKEYGIKLNISPLADPSGNVYTKIMTEVSQIDQTVQVLGVPGLLTRRTDTEMNVRAGDTIVIAGLLDAQTVKDEDKVAGLGDIPIIGALFTNKTTRSQLNELVIFVTPEIHDPKQPIINKANQRLIDETDRNMKKIRKKLEYDIKD